MFFICVLSSLFANEIRYIVTNDIKVRSCEDSNDNKQFVKDEELIFTYESLLDYYNSEISLKNPQDDNWYVFPIDFVQPYDNKYKITTSISKNPWIPFYYYDLLKSKNKIAELLKFEPFWNEWENYTDDEGLTWEKDFAIQRYYFDDYSFSIKTNVTRWLGLDSITLIKEISSNKIEYEVQAVFTGIYREDTDNLYNHPWFEKLLNKKTPFLLILTIDGDYIKMYIDEVSEENLFQTLIRTTPEACNQIEKWIKGESDDLSKVVMPKKLSVQNESSKATPSTNVTPNKIMTVSENLKLRSAEATTSEIITVMSAGTKVKILELGKTENIDGINSNWVKVEVQAGAKDRDGKPIKKGTVGWCYGGYLK
jgi:hypothetical protein